MFNRNSSQIFTEGYFTDENIQMLKETLRENEKKTEQLKQEMQSLWQKNMGLQEKVKGLEGEKKELMKRLLIIKQEKQMYNQIKSQVINNQAAKVHNLWITIEQKYKQMIKGLQSNVNILNQTVCNKQSTILHMKSQSKKERQSYTILIQEKQSKLDLNQSSIESIGRELNLDITGGHDLLNMIRQGSLVLKK